MYPENSVGEWIWKTTLNIHQLKNNKYKQSHICSNNQQMDLLDPWHIVSSILELYWPLIKILIWYPSNIWIILTVSPVWLSFLWPWTLFHLVHHHWHIVSSIFELSWPLIEILIWYPSSSWIILMVSPVWLSFVCLWTSFHLVHHHLASFGQFEILFGKYFLILHLFSNKIFKPSRSK